MVEAGVPAHAPGVTGACRDRVALATGLGAPKETGALPRFCPFPQPALGVVEATLDLAQLGAEVERVLPAHRVRAPGLSMAIDRRSCSTSSRLSVAGDARRTRVRLPARNAAKRSVPPSRSTSEWNVRSTQAASPVLTLLPIGTVANTSVSR